MKANKKLNFSLIFNIFTCIILIISLISLSYAWFNYSKTTTLSSIKVETGEDIELYSWKYEHTNTYNWKYSSYSQNSNKPEFSIENLSMGEINSFVYSNEFALYYVIKLPNVYNGNSKLYFEYKNYGDIDENNNAFSFRETVDVEQLPSTANSSVITTLKNSEELIGNKLKAKELEVNKTLFNFEYFVSNVAPNKSDSNEESLFFDGEYQKNYLFPSGTFNNTTIDNGIDIYNESITSSTDNIYVYIKLEPDLNLFEDIYSYFLGYISPYYVEFSLNCYFKLTKDLSKGEINE